MFDLSFTKNITKGFMLDTSFLHLTKPFQITDCSHHDSSWGNRNVNSAKYLSYRDVSEVWFIKLTDLIVS